LPVAFVPGAKVFQFFAMQRCLERALYKGSNIICSRSQKVLHPVDNEEVRGAPSELEHTFTYFQAQP